MIIMVWKIRTKITISMMNTSMKVIKIFSLKSGKITATNSSETIPRKKTLRKAKRKKTNCPASKKRISAIRTRIKKNLFKKPNSRWLSEEMEQSTSVSKAWRWTWRKRDEMLTFCKGGSVISSFFSNWISLFALFLYQLKNYRWMFKYPIKPAIIFIREYIIKFDGGITSRS